MHNALSRGIRTIGILLAVALLAPLLQPRGAAAAAPALGLNKAVAAGTSGFGTSQTATAGSTLIYQLTYSNTGTAAAAPLTITDVLAAGQTLNSYSSGCTSSLTSGGLTAVTCTVASVPTYPTAGSVGTIYIVTNVNSGFTGTIGNSAQASATGATTVTSNTVSVTVSGPPPPSNNFTLHKYVAVNGYTYGTSAGANVGDTLTYLLQFENNTGTTLSSVTLSDTLAAGQAFITPSNPAGACATYNTATRTVSCTLTNVPPGTFSVYILAGVQNGSSTIANQASATANATTVYSNPTYVTVGQPPQFFTGTFTICGVLTGYVPATTTTGTMTFFGQSYTTTPGITVTGQPLVAGLNACFTFTINSSGQIVAVNVTPNLTALNVVCGVYTTAITTTVVNTIMVSGYPFVVNGTFVSLLTVGAYYCFVVNNAGVAYILLSTVPTGIIAPTAGHGRGLWARMARAE